MGQECTIFSFPDFLARNSVTLGTILPLVHTLRAHKVEDILARDRLVAPECDVFANENLNYFFVGRPAYKIMSDSEEPAYWELPMCFIFEYAALSPRKRIFPFDSGAYHGGRFPSYIGKFDIETFDTAPLPDASERIIGAYFGTAERYFQLRPKEKTEFERDFSLSPLDAQVRALHRLAATPPGSGYDDRRFAIEVQIEGDLDLAVTKPLAVVLPMIYLDEPLVTDMIVGRWGAQPIGYPIFSQSMAAYYGMIYERVFYFYKNLGLL